MMKILRPVCLLLLLSLAHKLSPSSADGTPAFASARRPGADLATSSPPAEGWQALFHGTDLLHAISLDSTLLDFGSQSRLKSGEHRTLTVTNHTSVKLTAFIAGPLAVTQQQGQATAAPEVFQVGQPHTLPWC